MKRNFKVQLFRSEAPMPDSIVLVDKFHGEDWGRSLKWCSFLDTRTQLSSF